MSGLTPEAVRQAMFVLETLGIASNDTALTAFVHVAVQRPSRKRLSEAAAGVHVLRNPTLYNLLLKRGLVTDAGSGIPRLIQQVRERTGREPTRRLSGDEFIVTLPRAP